MMTEQGALYAMARDCAYTRALGKCKNKFGDYECSNCSIYIANYSQADLQSLKLFMYTAESSAQLLAQRTKRIKPLYRFGVWVGNLFVGLLKVAVALASIIGVAYVIHYWWVTDSPKDTVVQPELPIERPITTDTLIKNTLRAVQLAWYDQIDYSKDGLINCQDAAILFYKLYPDKENCGIESNAKLAHAFNVVKIDGVWRGIEPQAYINYKMASYFMKDQWGDAYDPAYNYDSWYKYGEFTK